MPTMRERFRHHHDLTIAEKAGLWETCTFVFDANVLLNIYRYTDQARDDLFRSLESVRDRIWMPHQSIHEFYRNRIGVIEEQDKKIQDASALIERLVDPLREAQFKKSEFLELEKLEDVFRPAIEKAQTAIRELRKRRPDLRRNDPYLDRLTDIVGDRLGTPPSGDDLLSLYKNCQARIEASVPPGYRDAKKPVPDRYGDVLIWLETIAYAKENKRPVVMITDDEKEDWWLTSRGERLGPRPELRAEMLAEGGVDFYLYRPARFLEEMKERLSVPVASASIENAKAVSQQSVAVAQKPSVVNWSKVFTGASAALAEWKRVKRTSVIRRLVEDYPPPGFIDFIAPVQEDGTDGCAETQFGRVAYALLPIGSRTSVRMVEILSARLEAWSSQSHYSAFQIFALYEDQDQCNVWQRAARVIRGTPPPFPLRIVLAEIDSSEAIRLGRAPIVLGRTWGWGLPF